jgi:uncharacterized protein YjdB
VLTATSLTNPTLSDQLSITIYDAVNSIQINGNAVVHLGTPETYLASVFPSTALADITWSVSDPLTALINQSGNLQPLQPGICTVFAKSVSNPLIQGSISINLYSLVQEVEFNTRPEEAFIGIELALEASVVPSTALQSLLWTIDNSDVATINPTTGILHPLTVGNITVTATSTDDPQKSESIEMTIYEVISSFTIEGRTKVRLYQVTMYSVTIESEDADQRFIWSLDNEEKADIDSEVYFYFRQEGTVTITATSVSDPTKFASLVVFVGPEYDDIESITINGPHTTLKIGETFFFLADVLPDFANKFFTWSVDNPSIGTINSFGNFTAKAVGQVTVTVTSDADPNFFDEMVVTVEYADLSSLLIVGPQEIIWQENEKEEYSVQISPVTASPLVTWGITGNATGEERDGIFYLTALELGTITLTATSQVNNEIFWSKEIEVVPPAPVSVSTTNVPSVIYVEQEIDLTVSFLPIIASQTFLATSESDKLRIEDNHLIALSTGTATILFTSTVDSEVFLSVQIEIYEYASVLNAFLSDLENQDYSIVREDGAYMIHSSENAYLARHAEIILQTPGIIGYFKPDGQDDWWRLAYDENLAENFDYFAYQIMQGTSSLPEISETSGEFDSDSEYDLLPDGTIKYREGNLLKQLNYNNFHHYLYLIFDLNAPEFFLAAYEDGMTVSYDKYLISHDPAPELIILQDFCHFNPGSFIAFDYTIDTFENYFPVYLQSIGYPIEFGSVFSTISPELGYYALYSPFDDPVDTADGRIYTMLSVVFVNPLNEEVNDWLVISTGELTDPTHYDLGVFGGYRYLVEVFYNGFRISQIELE